MSRLEWEIVHDADDEEGNPTMWVAVINHPLYGKYVWISEYPDGDYHVEVDVGGDDMTTKKICKSLAAAKRWVTMNML